MYKAIIEVGGYQVWDEFPTDKAEHWNKVFAVPHAKKVSEESEKSFEENKEEKKSETSEKTHPKNAMLDDYLSRNTNVVKKNVEEDDLSQEQLTNLLELEKSDKKREVIIQALQKKLNEIGD